MKTQRHAAILRVIRRETVKNQEQLRARLHAEGFDVTQATLSRDIRELGLAKVAAPDGGSHYAPPPEGGAAILPSLERLLPSMLLSLDAVGPFVTSAPRAKRARRSSTGGCTRATSGASTRKVGSTSAAGRKR